MPLGSQIKKPAAAIAMTRMVKYFAAVFDISEI